MFSEFSLSRNFAYKLANGVIVLELAVVVVAPIEDVPVLLRISSAFLYSGLLRITG
jgi:hypothetical protein